MYVKVEPSGCCEWKGLVQIRFCMYLDEGDYGYGKHYVQVPVVPKEGYPGEVDESGEPKDIENYRNWLASLPRVWQTNPFHNHFIYVEPDTTDEEIKAQMQFHLPNFYAAWCAGKPIRSGWDVKTRKRPKRYDKIEEPEVYALRKTRCLARIESVKSIFAQIKTNEKGETFPATAIDIGPGATDRTDTMSVNYMVIDLANPANDTGIIDTFQVYFETDSTGTKMGTFQDTGAPKFTPRDVEVIGNVTADSTQTFSGLDCDVVIGDYAGIYTGSAGLLSRALSGGSGYYYKEGDQFGAGEQTYEGPASNRVVSIYGTGETPAVEPKHTFRLHPRPGHRMEFHPNLKLG